MQPEDWYARRDDRQRRYANRVLPHDRAIVISIDPDHASSFDGQVSAIVAANLLSRMTPALVLDIPQTSIVSPLPWAGTELSGFILQCARDADPFAAFEVRKPRTGDYVLNLGRGPGPLIVHGSGWYAFTGPGSSPINPSGVPNPFGPSFASVAAIARLFALNLAPHDGPFAFDTFHWKHALEQQDGPYPREFKLGSIWTVGAGSVGSAALYFLTLATRDFSSCVFDMDSVKIENLDRSPIFTAKNADRLAHKADVAAAYLNSVGVRDSIADQHALDLSERWQKRSAGEPDLIIAAANERNVRYVIEQSCPPVQIYGTTGKNWVASVLRHIPFRDACSCCVFPPDPAAATLQCAEGKITQPETGHEVDAALPFLSFAAGLMAAAEVVKTQLPGYPFSPNRTVFSTGALTRPRFTSLHSPVLDQCVCQDRSASVLRHMIAGTRYENLSK